MRGLGDSYSERDVYSALSCVGEEHELSKAQAVAILALSSHELSCSHACNESVVHVLSLSLSFSFSFSLSKPGLKSLGTQSNVHCGT